MEIRIIIPNEIYDYHEHEIKRLLDWVNEELGIIHGSIYMMQGENLK
jgi:hypothetical protein